MKERVIFQSDILVNNGRNIVIVFPELPWSAGTASDDSRRKGDNLILYGLQRFLRFITIT